MAHDVFPGKRIGLGALLVGYYKDGDFVFAGKIGTGFDTKLLLDLRARLDKLEIEKPPFTRAVGLPRLRRQCARFIAQGGVGLAQKRLRYELWPSASRPLAIYGLTCSRKSAL